MIYYAYNICKYVFTIKTLPLIAANLRCSILFIMIATIFFLSVIVLQTDSIMSLCNQLKSDIRGNLQDYMMESVILQFKI